MLKSRVILILGLWVAILPYLGFPKSIKNILFSITGAFLVYISLIIYKQKKLKKNQEKTTKGESFFENREFLES